MSITIRNKFHSERVRTPVGKKSLTKQSFKDQCDINNILAGYQKTGIVNHVSKYQARYDDVEPIDYHTAMNIVVTTNSMFAELPSSVRAEFNHDPKMFLEAVQNPDKYQDVLVKHGLLEAAEQTEAAFADSTSVPLEAAKTTNTNQAEPAEG